MITITQFPNKFAKKPSKVQAELDASRFREFALALSHAVMAKKDDAAVFTLCEFGPEDNRKKPNIKAVTGIVLDIDGATSIRLSDICVSRRSSLGISRSCWVA